MNDKFADKFFSWIDNALPDSFPQSVRGISFNIFNWHDEEHGVELVGTERFDEADSDWACEEIWEAKPRSLDIPTGTFALGWEACLEGVKSLVEGYLQKGAKKDVLKSIDGIGIGFVDGELHIVSKRGDGNA